MLDPISDGNKIFEKILKKYPEKITDINIAEKLLNEVIKETKTWVIVDFLDCGCWDQLRKVKIDSENEWLYFIDYEQNIDSDKENGYRTGLIVKFKEIITYSSASFSGIFVSGYAIKKNKIKKVLSQNSDEFLFSEDRESNFALDIDRTCDNIKESYMVLNSQLYSMSILPKNIYLESVDSQELLFSINFNECLNRLEERKAQLLNVPQSDEDTICEKANTGRRIFEFVLKIECCILQHKVSLWGYKKPTRTNFEKDYDKLLLGDLKKMINPYKPKIKQSALDEIIYISNKLSHDSGGKIFKQEAIDLFSIMIDYTEELAELIKDHKTIEKYYTSNLKKINYDNTLLKVKTFSDLKSS